MSEPEIKPVKPNHPDTEPEIDIPAESPRERPVRQPIESPVRQPTEIPVRSPEERPARKN